MVNEFYNGLGMWYNNGFTVRNNAWEKFNMSGIKPPIYGGRVLKDSTGRLMFHIQEANSPKSSYSSTFHQEQAVKEARRYLGRYIALPEELLKNGPVLEGDLLWIYQSPTTFDSVSNPHDLKRKPGDECFISGFTLKHGYTVHGLVSVGGTGLLEVGKHYNSVKLRSKNIEDIMNNFEFNTLDGILTGDSVRNSEYIQEMVAYYEDYLHALQEKISSLDNQITGVQNDIRSSIMDLIPDGYEDLPSHYDFQKVSDYLYDVLYPLLGDLEERLNKLLKLEISMRDDLNRIRNGVFFDINKEPFSLVKILDTQYKLESFLREI